MRQQLENESRVIFEFSGTFLRWLCVSLVIGVIGGVIGSAFYMSVTYANTMRQAYPWLLWFLPAGGIVIAALYHSTRTAGKGTNEIINSILLGDDVPIVLTPSIFIGTVITHFLGGSAGREGAALQIGGSIGCTVGNMFRLDEKQERLAVLSGMAAVFSALFGTPVTAVVFALEVCSVGIIHYSGLVPCGVASITAYGIMRLFNLAPTKFLISVIPKSTPMMLRVCALAILCAVLSVVFCRVMHASGRLARKALPNDYIRIAIGGCAIIALTLLVGTTDYNGSGVSVISQALIEGEAKPEAFALKMLFTAITLGFGFKGGEIVPTFFIGATFGCVVGPLLGIPSGFAAAVGLAATFCGAVNCPIATVILCVEIFGSADLLYFAPACFISYMLSGYTSLYGEQKIMYSKLKAEFINRKAE